MWLAPVRVMRETLRVEASALHWMEKVGYKMIFAFETEGNEVLEDMIQYMAEKTKKYEAETYRLRLKAYEKIYEGMYFILSYSIEL